VREAEVGRERSLAYADVTAHEQIVAILRQQLEEQLFSTSVERSIQKHESISIGALSGRYPGSSIDVPKGLYGTHRYR
jgi:hypothetical protein